MQITALTAILARRINMKGLTSKGAKIMKILLPEWSLIGRWDVALKLLQEAFRTRNRQICFCVSWALQHAKADSATPRFMVNAMHIWTKKYSLFARGFQM